MADKLTAATQGTRVMLPGGQVAEFPPDMKHADIEAAVRKHLGIAEPKPEPPAEPSFIDKIRAEWTKPRPDEPLTGALLDTLGLSGREGAVPLTGAPGTKTPLGVVLKPEGLVENLTSAAVTATPIAKAGVLGGKALTAAPKLGAALGRVAAGTGIAAGKDIAKSGGVGWETVIDAALEGGTEAIGGALGKVLKKAGAPARGYAYATEAPEKALDYVRNRLQTTRMVIPSIDPTKKITWDEAIAALKKMTGQDYRVARAEIAQWMNMADRQELRPRAGQVFKDATAKFRVPASGTAKIAEGARKVVGANAPRAAADVAATEDVEGVPAGFYAWEALKSGGGKMLEKLGSPFLKAAGHLVP